MRARTTVRLDERLLKDVKRYALERNKTLAAVFEEALRRMLESNLDDVVSPLYPSPTTAAGHIRE